MVKLSARERVYVFMVLSWIVTTSAWAESGAVGATPSAVSGVATVDATSVTLTNSGPPTSLPGGTHGAGPVPFGFIPAAPTMGAPPPSSTTVSITGAGATYTATDTPCDFCTGRTNTVATHTPIDAGTADVNPVTGDAKLFGKHNLTPTGANTGEICAFCHTPQGSESSVASPPLWNRSAPTMSSYRAYSSLGSATAEATGSVSMSCLSCHDGTQAPNIVINTPNNKLDVPSDEVVDIGNDLKNHHPVGMPYAGGGQDQNAPDIIPDPIDAYAKLQEFNRFTSSVGNKFTFFNRRGVISSNDIAAFNDVQNFNSNVGNFTSPKGAFNRSMHSGTGNGTVWWVETPNSKSGRQNTDLYLFTRTDEIDSIPSESKLSQPYVECATCHDPHSSNATFLRVRGGNARSQVCLTCHNK
jgi:predicted CXXCH cytochrome family protein